MVRSSSGLFTVSATLAEIKEAWGRYALKEVCADYKQPRSGGRYINVCYGKRATTYCTTSKPPEYDDLEDYRPLGCAV